MGSNRLKHLFYLFLTMRHTGDHPIVFNSDEQFPAVGISESRQRFANITTNMRGQACFFAPGLPSQALLNSLK